MQMRNLLISWLALAAATQGLAQSALFDFENATRGTSLPLTLASQGLSARFSSSGLGGYYIQTPGNTILVNPAGFSGNALVPSSINGADLHIDFSHWLTNFSVLYAPQELACDSSATLRATAYLNGALVATTTTNAQAGTWPSETLSLGTSQPFNQVVVHYDKAPATGGDFGVIFVADNVQATLAHMPPSLGIGQSPGALQLNWPTNAVGFGLESSTNLGPSAAAGRPSPTPQA